MPSINLAPGTQYIVQARKRRRRLFGFSILIIIIIAVVWLGLNTYQGRLEGNLTGVNDQLRVVEFEIAKVEPNANRITLFEERLEALDDLLTLHISWNVVLQDVERLLPPTTKLTAFTAAGDSGLVNIEGVTENIDQVAITLATLLNSSEHETVFRSGTLGGIKRQIVGTDEEGVPDKVDYKFDAELRFDPSIIRNGN